MKVLALSLLLLVPPAIAARGLNAPARTPERLGTVSFPVSCSPAVQAPFNRGVALLHDFWYEAAKAQFEKIEVADPSCAMAHWGVAMSVFHQIWDRPGESSMAAGAAAMQKARALAAPPTPGSSPSTSPATAVGVPAMLTERERAYIAALSSFYQPGKDAFPDRVATYCAAMKALYTQYPDDPDAGAFYALSLLAAEPTGDTTLNQEHKALAVLQPLFARFPDHPGLAHYIIHAGDTPSLAPQALAAAQRYGDIAPSAAHAVHMPGHIFARLGMWQPDIDVNLQSVAASQVPEAQQDGSGMHQFHADDFLLYAYLQSGQDAHAKELLDASETQLAHYKTMPGMAPMGMAAMFAYYQGELPVFYYLEMRDWAAASALQPVAGAAAEVRTITSWAHAVAAGHLHDARKARASLATYDGLLQQIRNGDHAYLAESTGAQIVRGEMVAWVSFAEGNQSDALRQMMQAADLQDKVGQGEVDIPAREMLGDMLLELHQPQQALAAYKQALQLSPNRFNGLYHAGLAAEATGDKSAASTYYAALLQATGMGAQSSRPELVHAKDFVATRQLAEK